MKLDIYLIRHAETDLNTTPHIIQGRSLNARLSERGLEQAEKLGERLLAEGLRFDSVYSSTADRACQTAKIACGKIGIPEYQITRLEQLVEQSHGDWEGKLRNEMYTPEVVEEFKKDMYNFCPPNGESLKMAEERMYGFVKMYLFPLQSFLFETEIAKKAEKLLDNKLIKKTRAVKFISKAFGVAKDIVLSTQREDTTVAVFSHAMAIKSIARKIYGFSPEMAYRIEMFNTGITRVKYTEKGWFPVSLNDKGHLAGMENAPFTPLA